MDAAGRAALEARLWAAGCVAAAEEAAELLAAAPDGATLQALVRRRERGEPLAWVTGSVTFCGGVLRAAAGVYVPRPQTEALARRAAALVPPGGRAADLCTGVGAVAAHLAATRPGATVVGVDIDPRAAAVARSHGVAALVGDLDAPLRGGSFDVVTAVAPYVPAPALGLLPADARHEPRRAVDGGADGLDVVRRAAFGAARLLRPGGWFLTELGGDQHELLAPTLAAAGFGPGETWTDEEGDLRGVAARRATPPA